MATIENLVKRWDEADALLRSDKVVKVLSYAYSRWLDEGKYENIEDYRKYIQDNLPGFNVSSIKKRPFSFTIDIDEYVKMLVTVNSKSISWREYERR